MGFFIAAPSHGTSHTFGDHLTQKGQTHLYPYLASRFASTCTIVDQNFFLLFFEAIETHHCLLSPMDRFSLPQGKTAYTRSTSRRHLIFHGMSLLLYIRISFQKSFVRRLHSFFNGVMRFSLPNQSISQDLELLLKRKICDIPTWCQLKDHTSLQGRTCPPKTRRLRYQVPLHRFFNKSRSICSKFLLEWDKIQKLSAHMKLQI